MIVEKQRLQQLELERREHAIRMRLQQNNLPYSRAAAAAGHHSSAAYDTQGKNRAHLQEHTPISLYE